MEFRLETVYLGAKRFLYEKKSKITIESKTIKIPIPVKNDEMTVVKIPLHLGTDCYILKDTPTIWFLAEIWSDVIIRSFRQTWYHF